MKRAPEKAKRAVDLTGSAVPTVFCEEGLRRAAWASTKTVTVWGKRLMTTWIKNKLTTIIIAVVAVLTVAGAGVVMAAQNHTNTPRTSEGAAQPGQRFEATGV